MSSSNLSAVETDLLFSQVDAFFPLSNVLRFASNSGFCFYTSHAFLVSIVFSKISCPFMSSALVLLERKTFSVKLKCYVTKVPYTAAANVNKENI